MAAPAGKDGHRERTRPSTWLTVVAGLASFAGTTALLAAPQEPAPQVAVVPQFETSVELMRVHVTAHDSDGGFVSGLGVDDFELLVNGRPRQIVDVLEIDAATGSVDEAAGDVADRAAGALPAAPGTLRQFFIFLDLTAATTVSLRNARSASTEFVESMLQPADRLGLVVFSPYRGLQMPVPLTSRHELVKEALDQMSVGAASLATERAGSGVPMEEIADAFGADVADMVQEVEDTRYAMTVESLALSLAELGRALSVVQGRKHVVFFSTGLPDLVFEWPDFVESIADAAADLRASDTVVHAFHSGNPPDANIHDIRQMTGFGPRRSLFVDRSLLFYVAEETGGEATWFRPSLRRGLRDLEESTRSYYVLAFAIQSDDPATASLEVRSSRSGIAEVRAPARLSLPRGFTELTSVQRQLRVAEALELGTERSEIRMSLRGVAVESPGGGRELAAILSVPAAEMFALAADRGDQSIQLEIMGMVIGPAGNVLDWFQGRASTSGLASIETVRDFRYVNVARAPTGTSHLKLMVRETGTDRMTVRSLRFDVPEGPPAGLRLEEPLPVLPPNLVPFLWGRRSTGSPGTPEGAGGEAAGGDDSAWPYPFSIRGIELSPVPDRPVTPDSTQDYLLVMRGLEVRPEVERSWRLEVDLIDPAGTVVTFEPAVVLEEAMVGGAVRVVVRVGFSDALLTGPSELRFRVFDRNAPRQAEVSLPFTVMPR